MGCTSKLWEHLKPFETKERFEIVSIVVVDCKKSCGLIGTEKLLVETQKLIDNVKVEDQDIVTLKDYKATIKFKENSPSLL